MVTLVLVLFLLAASIIMWLTPARPDVGTCSDIAQAERGSGEGT